MASLSLIDAAINWMVARGAVSAKPEKGVLRSFVFDNVRVDIVRGDGEGTLVRLTELLGARLNSVAQTRMFFKAALLEATLTAHRITIQE